MNVASLLIKEYVCIDAHQKIRDIEDLLIQHAFLVVMRDDCFLGLLTLTDRAETSHLLVIDCLRDNPKIPCDSDPGEVLDLMNAQRYAALPVFDNGEFAGVITRDAITDYYVYTYRQALETRVAELDAANVALEAEIRARRQIEERLINKRNAIDFSINAIAIAKFDGQLTYVNPAFLAMWGYTDEAEVLGRSTLEFWESEDQARQVIQALRDGSNWFGEMTGKRFDGSLFDAQISASLVTDDAGTPRSMMASFVDITEHKRMRRELREREQNFRTLAENANDGILVSSFTGQHVYANQRAAAITGYSVDELCLITMADLAHPDELPKLRKRLRKFEANEEITVQYETVIMAKDGQSVPIEVTIALTTWQGESRVLVIMRDITGRKQAEADLHRYRHNLEHMIQARTAELSSANAQLAQKIQELQQSRNALRDRLEIEKLITSISNQFISSTPDDFHVNITRALREIGEFLDVTRVYINLLESDGHTIGERYEWIADQEKPEFSRISRMSLRTLPWTLNALNNFETIYCPDVVDLPAEAAPERELCRSLAVPSYIMLPLVTRERLKGLLGLNLRTPHKDWSEEDLTLLRLVTNLFANIFERQATEKALRESEAHYRHLFESTREGIIEARPDGEIISVNPAAVKLFGYDTAQELLGRSMGEFYMEPASRTAVLTMLKEHGYIENGELRLQRQDGSLLHALGNVAVQRDKHGKILKIEAMFTDITERKQMEEALRERERQFRTISDLVSDYAYELAITPDGKLSRKWVTEARVRITGYTSEEIDARGGWLTLVVPEDKERLIRQHQKFMAGNECVTEYRILSKHGDIRWLRDYNRPLWDDAHNSVTGALGVAQDITEYKQSKDEILLLKNAIETTQIGVSITTIDRTITYVNLAEAEMHGYTPEELIGQHARIFSPEELWQDIDFEQLEAGWERETVNICRDGTHFPVHSISTPVRDASGAPVGNITISEDITRRKHAEEILQQAKDTALEAQHAAETANRTKSEFLANMSHKLRTPLNAILGFTQLLRRDQNLSAIHQEYIDIINHSGEHLLELINDVLDMSKIEAGRVTLHLQNVDLWQLLERIEEMIRLRARNKGLALRFERAPEVPRSIRTDAGKLRQVLINLLNNAIKYTEQGSVTLRVNTRNDGVPESRNAGKGSASPTPTRQHANTLTLHFEITDTGIGIAPAEQETLFEAFHQTHNITPTTEGTGLGLTISRNFVRLLGGDIHLSSEPGKGSVFTFHIHTEPVAEPDVEMPANLPPVVGLEPGQPEFRILVVEDNAENRLFMTRLLEIVGFRVCEAVNGEKAVEQYLQWQPHLIWMDIRLPVVDGYAATQQIRTLEQERKVSKRQRTIIIGLTSGVFQSDKAAVLTAGCNDFVRKPVREHDVFSTMRTYLGVRYIYANDPQRPSSSNPTSPEALRDIPLPDLTAMLFQCPQNVVRALEQAAAHANVKLVNQSIDHIRSVNPALAAYLAHLAKNFQYREMLTLIQRIQEEPHAPESSS